MLQRLLGKLTRWGMRDLDGALETVALMRRWAARSPRYDVDLATSLVFLSNTQARAGRPEDALASLEEAERISRRGQSARYEQVLASALHKQSLLRCEAEQWDEALGSAEQAAEVYRRLLPTNPNRFEPRFGQALTVVVACLHRSGRVAEALPLAEQAVRIGRRLAHDVEEHEPALADALHNLGACLTELERYEEGLRATEEAIAIRRRLSARHPGEYDSDLASSERNRDASLSALTRQVAKRAEPGEVVLGPYPLCDRCKKVNGGLVAVRHRQVHVRAHGKESCVDVRLTGIITKLWAVCSTVTSCEDDDGRAYVVPAGGHLAAAEQLLTSLGISVENEQGALYFRLPPGEAM